jgi:hypothetical protein
MAREIRMYFRGTDAAAKRSVQATIATTGAGRERALFEVVITERRPTRSLEANRYYFGVIVKTFAEHLRDNACPLPDGFSSYQEYAHALLKEKCLRIPVLCGREIGGHVTGSTAALDVSEFHRYVTDCREWLEELGMPTPDAEPVYAEQPRPELRRRNTVSGGA